MNSAEELPVEYYRVVFTLPAPISDIAYQNLSVIYSILFKAAAETLITIAADPKHLGARIGLTAVLHTWGSALTHYPHVHCVVTGGGISADGKRWYCQVKPLSATIGRWNHNIEGIVFHLKASVTLSGYTIGSP